MILSKSFGNAATYLALFASILMIAACDKEMSEIEESKIDNKLSAQDRVLISANNKLSIDLLNASFARNDTSNFFFSPVSMGMSLGMLYNGVGEDEKLIIDQIAGFESLEPMEINKSYNQLLNFFAVNNSSLQLTCANSMWFSSEMDINEDYRTKMMAYYDAEVSEINFSKKTSLQYINNWGNLKTEGVLPGLLATPPALNSKIVMVNGIGLNTSWTKGSYFYGAGHFKDGKGETVFVPTLNMDAVYTGTLEETSLRFIEFGLKNDQIRFTAIQLPDTRSIRGFLEDFSEIRLENMTSNARYSLVNLTLPQMPQTSSISMKPALSSFGLSKLFANSADLTPSFNTYGGLLSDVEHTATIHFFNQEVANDNAEFINPDLSRQTIDLPFLYFISEKNTGAILFAGYFISPAE